MGGGLPRAGQLVTLLRAPGALSASSCSSSRGGARRCHHWISSENAGPPLARNAQGISMSSPSRTVTSLGTSVNVAGGGEETGVTQCGAGARAAHPAAPRAVRAPAKFSRAVAGPPQRAAPAQAASSGPGPGGGPREVCASLPPPPTPAPRAGLGRARPVRTPGAPRRRPFTALPLPLRAGCSRDSGDREALPFSPSCSSSSSSAATRAAGPGGPARTPHPEPPGSEVPALTVGREEQQGVQQQRRQVSEGAELAPLVHLPRGARRPGRGEAAAAAAAARARIRLGSG